MAQLDASVLAHIQRLVTEEHKLFDREHLTSEENHRLTALQVELDQCWDLLRQRRAKREFGLDPDDAQARSADTVEHYRQ